MASEEIVTIDADVAYAPRSIWFPLFVTLAVP